MKGSAEVEVASDGDSGYLDLFGLGRVDLLEGRAYLTFAWRKAKDVGSRLASRRAGHRDSLGSVVLPSLVFTEEPTTLP